MHFLGKGSGAEEATAPVKGRRHRRRLRSVALTAAVVAGGLGIAACGGSSKTGSSGNGNPASATGLYGALPSASSGAATNGGTLTVSQLQGATPLYIMPIVPSADASVYGNPFFIYQMFEPLYNANPTLTPGFDLGLSIGQKPTVSGKTVTIQLNKGWTWANGAPVDANDVIFNIDEIKAAVSESAANFEAFSPGLFPQNVVSATASSKYTVKLTMNKLYNPNFLYLDQLNLISPMPSTAWNIASANGPHLDYTNPANAKKIYNYLASLGGALSKFGSTPLWQDVDGPYKISSFSPTNGGWTLTKNTKYSGPDKPHIDEVQGVTYTGITPLLNAEKTGAVDIGSVDQSQLGQVDLVKNAGYSVFGYPDLGWNGAFFNFKDKTNDFDKVISQLYARQALAHLEDQPAYVTGIYKNAGGQAYGPAPSIPKTQFTPSNASTPVYSYSPAAAKQLLTSHGWNVVPNGTSTCAKPGTGAGECGAGIPKGTPFEFTWDYLTPTSTVIPSLTSEALASQAAKLGIKITLQAKAFNYSVTNDNDVATPSNANNWGVVFFGGYTDDLYPTQNSIFNTGGSYNQGGYSSPGTNAAINESVYGSQADAATSELNNESSQLPVLFFPEPDYIYAVSNKVTGPPQALGSLTDFNLYPQLFSLKKGS